MDDFFSRHARRYPARPLWLRTEAAISSLPWRSILSCTAHVPQIDTIFVMALLASMVLNWAATLLSTTALAKADASLVGPLLAFNPAFTLLIVRVTSSETPGLRQTIGVAVVLLGSFLLEVEEARTGLLAPILILLSRSGTILALVASVLWGATTVLEKLSIEHMTPPSGPVAALLGTFLLALLLTPGAFQLSKENERVEPKGRFRGLRAHPRALCGSLPSLGLTLFHW